MPPTFRHALLTLLTLIVLGCGIAAWQMHREYQQTVGRRIAESDQRLNEASTDAEKRFTTALARGTLQSSQIRDLRTRREWETILSLTLADHSGVAGGFWTPQDGFVAFAFPTYQGDLAQKDLPSSDTQDIAALNRECLAAGRSASRHLEKTHETLLLKSLPLNGGSEKIALWTLTRTPVMEAGARSSLTYGLISLLALTVFAGALISWMLSQVSVG